jgi:hypothetical protein
VTQLVLDLALLVPAKGWPRLSVQEVVPMHPPLPGQTVPTRVHQPFLPIYFDILGPESCVGQLDSFALHEEGLGSITFRRHVSNRL